jgi:hypothetical protein
MTRPGPGTGAAARGIALLIASVLAVALARVPSAGATPNDAGRSGSGIGKSAVVGTEGVPSEPAEAGPRNRIMGTGEAPAPQPFTREQRLLEAAREGDRATVERALELGVPVESADDLGRSALLLAARDAGDLELVRFLHERGAEIDRPDADGRTPLSFAAAAGRLELVRYLAREGAAVDSKDDRDRTPLFHAVLFDRRETVAWLLEHGAEVDVADRFGDTPLMMACAKDHAEMARLLLAHGADARARDQEGRTAADRAAPGLEDVCRPDDAA